MRIAARREQTFDVNWTCTLMRSETLQSFRPRESIFGEFFLTSYTITSMVDEIDKCSIILCTAIYADIHGW